MAKIVLAVGSSHGPSIQMDPETWPRLGAKDTRDPRFDYDALLKAAKPGLESEITPDVQRARHGASHAALRKLSQMIADAALDAVVVVSNAHNLKSQLVRPVFGVLRSAELPVQSREKTYVIPGEGDRKPPESIEIRPGAPDLANQLLENLIGGGFDVACIDRLAEGTTLDDAFAFTYGWLLGDAPTPLVPFYLSRDLPNQPSPTRCIALGKALRRAIDAWPEDKRIGLVASGGLSHQIIDEELDRGVIDALQSGDEGTMAALSPERLNGSPGTPEILNWITVAAAMAPVTMKLVDYIPAYRSLAGTGHGLTFGYWNPSA